MLQRLTEQISRTPEQLSLASIGAFRTCCKMSLTGQCTGVLGAVALPVVGVGVGVAQIVRGVANTPESIREQHKGKSWDQVIFNIFPHEQVCTPGTHFKNLSLRSCQGHTIKKITDHKASAAQSTRLSCASPPFPDTICQ